MNGDTVTVDIVLNAGTTGGLWDIKVSQIECSNPLVYVAYHPRTRVKV